MILSIDTETTGLNPFHGCRPHFVGTFDGEAHLFYEWEVDPLTRRVAIPPDDLEEIAAALERAERAVGHNVKFDASMLLAAGLRGWPWDRTECTLLAGHLLESAMPHDLTSMCVRWLDEPIEHLEDRLGAACQNVRRRVQQARLARRRGAPKPPSEDALADWRIAEAGLPEIPSAGQDDWKADAWAVRQIARLDGLEEPDPDCAHRWQPARGRRWKRIKGDRWKEVEEDGAFEACADCLGRREWVLCREYALGDVETTWHLWAELERELTRRGHLGMHRERCKTLRWLREAEARGTTVDRSVLRDVRTECVLRAEEAEAECMAVAIDRGCDLELPKAGRNGSLDRFLFGWGRARCAACGKEQDVDHRKVEWVNRTRPRCNFCKDEGRDGEVTAEGDPGLALEPVSNPEAKTDKPAFDAKLAIPHYLATLPPDSDTLRFLRAFERRGHALKAVSYCDSYEKFGLPVDGEPGWLSLHPSFNAAGTQLLRRSCSDPNLQNVGKKKEANLRRAFGPAPGREWWSLDYKNIELRIPAYEARESELIALFERPDDPPYYGSEHLINFSTVYPDVWEGELGKACADKCCAAEGKTTERTVGPHCKRQFEDTWYQWCKNGDFAVGYQAGDATADRAFHRPGSRARLRSRFARKDELNSRITKFAVRHGFVETIPDREVSPESGYRLMVTRTERGDVLSTVPLNFHVQGTAGWIQARSINRVGPRLLEWTEADPRGFFLIIEVHDELVFDFPAGSGAEPWRTNLPKIREIQRLMETGGADVGVPTPVDVEWCPKNWADGMTIKNGQELTPPKTDLAAPPNGTGPAAFLAARKRAVGAP